VRTGRTPHCAISAAPITSGRRRYSAGARLVIDAGQSVGALPLDVAALALSMTTMVNRERGCARGACTISAARPKSPAPDMNVCAVRLAAPFRREVLHLVRGARDLKEQDEAPPAAPDAPPVHWPSPGPSAKNEPPDFISDHPRHETRVEHIEARRPEAENEYGSTFASGRREGSCAR
jgi:hypothetical protein